MKTTFHDFFYVSILRFFRKLNSMSLYGTCWDLFFFLEFLFWQVDRLSAISALDRPSSADLSTLCLQFFKKSWLTKIFFVFGDAQMPSAKHKQKSACNHLETSTSTKAKNWPQFHVLNFSFALVISWRLLSALCHQSPQNLTQLPN